MELDRQGIERRDFPIVRRGYDPASVDAHLRTLASEVEEFRNEASNRGRDSLASTAGTQVQGILEAAQATAETIEREAALDAQGARDAANADARRIREEAVAHAQRHVTGVSKATEALLERVGSMDGEGRALVDSLRSGASRLASDLAAVEANMGALYDSAAGRSGDEQEVSDPGSGYNGVGAPGGHDGEGRAEPFVEVHAGSNVGVHGDPHAEMAHGAPTVGGHPESYDAETYAQPEEIELAHGEESLFAEEEHVGEQARFASEDLDGARLVALNMALNGDSRDATGRYLAENFDVPDRDRLLDEVYAAIEG